MLEVIQYVYSRNTLRARPYNWTVAKFILF